MRRSPIQHALAQLRSTLNLGQKELADLVGCTAESVKSIELNRLKLSEGLATRISLETGVSVQWLLNNDLSAPIAPSLEVASLQRRVGDPEPGQYTRRTFELVQAQEWDIYTVADINQERLDGLKDYVRLRAIIESARYQRLHGLARYKLEKFLEEMEKEFSSDPKKLFLKGVEIESDNSIAFVEAELTAAKRLNHLLNKDPSSDELDETNWDYEAMDRFMIEALSPYEDRSDPAVAARIGKAMAQAKANDEKAARRRPQAQRSSKLSKKKPLKDKMPSAKNFKAGSAKGA